MATHMYILYEIRIYSDDSDSKILGCYSNFINAKNALKEHLINYLGEQDSEGDILSESFYDPILRVNDENKEIGLLKKNLPREHVLEISSNNSEDTSDFITTGNQFRENSCLKIRYSDNGFRANEFYLRIEKVEVSNTPLTKYSDYVVKEVLN
jgi:hypothetical protein